MTEIFKKQIEERFEKIKKQNKDFNKSVSLGNVYIPDVILRNKMLTVAEKFYLATYYCFDKNVNKADIYMKDYKSSLPKIKKHLYEIGILNKKKINYQELKKTTIEKSYDGEICEWCGNKSYVLQKHHFPIPACKGGIETVNICPNCHYTYHKLLEEEYE